MSVLSAVVAVVLLNIYAALLVALRSSVYRVRVYRPMLLNIALSFAPVVVAIVAVVGLLGIPALQRLPLVGSAATAVALWAYLAVGTIVWLLFFPNSIYLITELNFTHRREDDPIPLWFDIVQTLTLVLSGIGNAVLSLAVMQMALTALVLDPQRGEPVPLLGWVFAAVVITLGAVGVYLGRYLRFNSWDVRHPISMVRKLRAHLRQRGKALEAAGFVLTHAVMLALVYAPLYGLAYAALAG